jgi:adenylate cyclase class 2
LEIEIKLDLDDPGSVKRQLVKLGFSVAKRRVLEINTVFDTPAGVLRSERKLLRLRQAGSRRTLTFKGPPMVSRYKSREEIESGFSDDKAMRLILGRLGYEPVFRYEKYRTEYTRPGEAGSVVLDETPIGDFLELEGSPRWIERTARALGRSPAEYITASYGALYQQHCQASGAKPGDMVFRRDSPKRQRGGDGVG